MSTRHKMYRNKDWLYQKYRESNLSIAEIAKLCHCHGKTVREWMIRLGIERRSVKEALDLTFGKGRNFSYRKKKWLYKMYWKRGNSVKRIAAMCGVDKSIIKYWLDKHGIERRNHREAQELWLKKRHGSLWIRIIPALRGPVSRFKKYF